MVGRTSPAEALAGRYRLLEVLGRGGMGEVWRAEDLKTRQTVAVKVLRPYEDEDEKHSERFIREAQSTARFSHPNIVRVLGFGELSGGTLYLTMEFVAGETLRRVLKRDGRLAPARAVRIATQMCAALQAVHEAGIVHRDVKPGNVMLVPANPELAKLIDFGIARGDAEETQLTTTGLFIGTTEYCAPEQISGHGIDGRTDQYALGAVLYLALTGSLPFEGPGLAAMMHQHLHQAPMPLSQRGAAVPAALEAVVLRCLAKKQGDRFASMKELGAALESVARSQPLAEASPGAVLELDVSGPISTRVAERFASLELPGATARPEHSPEKHTLPPEKRPAFDPKIELVPRETGERRGPEAYALTDPGSRRARTLVSVLSMLSRLAAFHPARDPALRLPLAHLRSAIEEILLVEGWLELKIAPPMLQLNRRRVEVPLEGVESLSTLSSLLASRGLASLSAPRPPTAADLERFVAWLGATSDETPEELASRMVTLRLTLSGELPGDRALTRPARPRTVVVAWVRAFRFMADYLAELARGSSPDSSGAMAFAEELAGLAVARRPLFGGLALGQVPQEPYAAHLANVAALAVAFAAELGLGPAQLRDLAYVGLFHGAGLTPLDPLVSLRLDALTGAGQAALREAPMAVVVRALSERDAAPVLWRRALTGFERAIELAAPVCERARAHKPGPGLRARILTLSATFEALVSPCAGREPLAPQAALQFMGEKLGDRLDRELLAPFALMIAGLVLEPLSPAVPGAKLVPAATAVRLLAAKEPVASAALKARLQQAAREEDGAEFSQRLAAMVCYLAEQGPQADKLIDLVLPIFDGLLLQEDFGPAAELLVHLRQIEQRSSSEGPAARLVYLLASRLGDEERLLHLGQVLRRAPARAARDLVRFLGLLESTAVPGLLDVLGSVELPENRQLLCEALASFARRSPEVFISRIESPKGLLVGDLAAILQRAGHPQLISLLSAAATGANPRVKAQLLEVAARVRTGGARSFVAGHLDDPSAQVRAAAARCLPGCGEAEAAKELLARVARPDFGSKSLSEREAFFAALAAAAVPEGLRHLEQVLARKAGMLGRGKLAEEKLAVISALGQAPSIHTARLLRAAASDSKQPSAVAQAAQAALTKVQKTLGLSTT